MHRDHPVLDRERHAESAELLEHQIEMLLVRVSDGDFASCRRAEDEECRRFIVIGNHGVFRAGKRRAALYMKGMRSESGDRGAHLYQKTPQILDVRFAGRDLDRRFSGQRGGQHHGDFPRGDGKFPQHYLCRSAARGIDCVSFFDAFD
jgi:hypothetical protein